ncbi:MAG: hypothetical protein HYZ43_08945 [Flavobacteriia bacterium]|nr:hypothetical protein [Flavobacteriia bacterium]
MKKHLLFFACVLAAFWVKADFVDVATISINGKMIRKLTNNSRNPYLINLDNYHVGDTVSIKIWTDYGGENNAFVTVHQLINGHTDTLSKKNRFILTDEFFRDEFLISVTFIDPLNNRGYNWNICKIVPDHRIEIVYEQLNDFTDLLLALKSKKEHIASPLLKDSVFVNFKQVSGVRQLTDTIGYPITRLYNLLQFTKTETSYLERFNAVDYMAQYDFETDMYASIRVEENTIDEMSLSFGDFTYQLTFHFKWNEGSYLLERISFQKR